MSFNIYQLKSSKWNNCKLSVTNIQEQLGSEIQVGPFQTTVFVDDLNTAMLRNKILDMKDHQLLQISYSQPLVVDCCATMMLHLPPPVCWIPQCRYLSCWHLHVFVLGISSTSTDSFPTHPGVVASLRLRCTRNAAKSTCLTETPGLVKFQHMMPQQYRVNTSTVPGNPIIPPPNKIVLILLHMK